MRVIVNSFDISSCYYWTQFYLMMLLIFLAEIAAKQNFPGGLRFGKHLILL